MIVILLFMFFILVIMCNIKILFIFTFIIVIIMLNIEQITIVIIILLIIWWVRKTGNESSRTNEVDEGSENFRRSASELKLQQIKKYNNKYLQQINRKTYFHPPNNLQPRVVNNNLHIRLPKGAEVNYDTVDTSQLRSAKFVTNDTERQRSFVSRKDTLLKKADEIKTATGCDIYMEMRYENKIHLYKSETLQNDGPVNESKRSQNKRKLELGDDSDTEDNGLSPVKIQKNTKATKGDIMHTEMESGIETDIEVDEIYCNICETTDDYDIRGPFVVCEYKHEDFSSCLYTAHLLCLDLHEYPPYFLCPEHISLK
ncbi:uncharacterized protein LOC134713817 [Mytilus trossulus]|uniref:uncharacterized protein LOC134713817 n=1 Tax=Mytilus trossulus TaxID=6551 RepID=UPI0030059874